MNWAINNNDHQKQKYDIMFFFSRSEENIKFLLRKIT